jgi:hypothetical protein
MIASPAWITLSRSARQVLDRIEIEHAHHGGAENGRLPVTYEHFIEYGLHRRMIAPAIREAVALGFLEVTQKWSASPAEFRRPSLYRLTYLPRYDAGKHDAAQTNEWRRIETIEQAEHLAEDARKDADPTAVRRAKNRIPVPLSATGTSATKCN